MKQSQMDKGQIHLQMDSKSTQKKLSNNIDQITMRSKAGIDRKSQLHQNLTIILVEIQNIVLMRNLLHSIENRMIEKTIAPKAKVEEPRRRKKILKSLVEKGNLFLNKQSNKNNKLKKVMIQLVQIQKLVKKTVQVAKFFVL